MPKLSVWALRAALLHLLAGLTIGALLLANKGLPLWPRVWMLLPAHTELLLLGWTVQLALAVAYWILPRLPGGIRGRETAARLAFGLLNLGVLLAAAQPLHPALFPMGRLCEMAAAGLFTLHAWQRIRPLVFNPAPPAPLEKKG